MKKTHPESESSDTTKRLSAPPTAKMQDCRENNLKTQKASLTACYC